MNALTPVKVYKNHQEVKKIQFLSGSLIINELIYILLASD